MADEPQHVEATSSRVQPPPGLTDAALNAASEGISIADARGRLLWVNDAFTKLTGYALDDIVGRTCKFLQGPDTDPATVAEIRMQLHLTGEFAGEILNYRRDGSVFWNDLSITTVHDAPGRVGNFVGVMRDTTRRRRDEASLRWSQALLRVISDSSPLAFLIHDLQSKQVLFYNQRFADVWGFDPFVAAGVDFSVAAVVDRGAALVADPGKYRAIVRALTDPRQTSTVEAEVSLTSGRTVRLVSVPLRDDSASFLGRFDIFEDITARAIADEELRQSKARNELAFEGSPIGMALLSPAGRFIQVNASLCRLLDRTEDDLLALTWLDITHPDDDRERNVALVEALLEGSMQTYELTKRFLRGDGTPIAVQVNVSLVRTVKGAPLYFVAQIQDLTARQQAEIERVRFEARLRQSEKIESIGRLAGGVAHDFNNMLGVILGHLELALEAVAPTDPLFTDLVGMRQAAERSAELTRQLLAFARMQPVAPSLIDVNESVRALMDMLPRLIGENVEIDFRPSPASQPVFVDRSQLDQILTNLVLNARDALVGVSGGRIDIRTYSESLGVDDLHDRADLPPGDYVTITVSDNGHGMDDDTLTHIFEPFFTKKAIGTGTGLGLATVFGAITQNRGFIEVTSELGRGSTFTVHLPRHSEPKLVGDDVGSATVGALDQGTVLLVEDQADLLDVTTRMLRRCGVEVLAAQSPAAAIALAEQHHARIHVIITDVIMPGVNGQDLAQQITSRYPHITPVFMSGYTSDVIAQNGIVEQGVHFLQKPFSTEQLRATLHAALHEGRPSLTGDPLS